MSRTMGKFGVLFEGKFSIIVCAVCGVDGKMVVAMCRGEDGKAYLSLTCGSCQQILTAMDNPERVCQLIEHARDQAESEPDPNAPNQ